MKISMDIFIQQLRIFPLIALFLSLGIGFIFWKFKVKKFVLGGIIGTLIQQEMQLFNWV